MEFNRYKACIISDFEEDCLEAGFIKEKFSNEEILEINERFEEHKECFIQRCEFSKLNEEVMSSVTYGNNDNIAIECFQCNSVIIDTDILKGDEV